MNGSHDQVPCVLGQHDGPCKDKNGRMIPLGQQTLSHPCKETCSGWKQGFDEGAAEVASLKRQIDGWISALETVNAFLKKHNAQDLFDRIKHGDEAHQLWLKTELEKWFNVP